jgi:Protein of unknown function (DUF4242)
MVIAILWLIKNYSMKKFIIERNLPGAGNLTPEELQAISQTSCEVVNQLDKPYHWTQSFVTDDKIYCIHIAESEDVIREHARKGNFPINMVAEVKAVIDPTTGNL